MRSPVLLLALMLVAGCGGGSEPTTTDPGAGGGGSGDGGSSGGGGSGGGGETVSFAVDVQPVFASVCIHCHGGAGGLNLDSYAGLMAGGNSGAAVVAGDPAGSLLIERLTVDARPFKPKMPPDSGVVTDAQIDFIRTWIREGAKDN